jgi:hypothetical protein
LSHLGTALERWKLIRTWTFRGPTWRGALLALAVFAFAGVAVLPAIHPYLAVTDRLQTSVLVVEGWLPDFALQAALDEFHRGGYREIWVTGGPLERGSPLFEHRTHAELGRVILEKLGAPPGVVRAVPAPKVQKDRTFASAVALRKWWRQQPNPAPAFNVLSTDAHARRTRLLFAKAFGDASRIGIIATPDERYDGARWWRSSDGVRTVLSELIAYTYARIFASLADDLVEPAAPAGAK